MSRAMNQHLSWVGRQNSDPQVMQSPPPSRLWFLHFSEPHPALLLVGKRKSRGSLGCTLAGKGFSMPLLTTLHWLSLSHKFPPNCKGSWEICSVCPRVAMHGIVSTIWRFPKLILSLVGCFHGFPRDAPGDGSFLNVEDQLSHWLLIIPPKPEDIWLSPPSVGVTLPFQKSSPGWSPIELQAESFQLVTSWPCRKHLCSPSVNYSLLPRSHLRLHRQPPACRILQK